LGYPVGIRGFGQGLAITSFAEKAGARQRPPFFLIGLLVVVLLAGAAYAAYAGASLYVHLHHGGDGLVSAQAKLSAGLRSGTPEAIRGAQSDLAGAGHDFSAAYGSARDDPAFRLLGGLPATGGQVEASLHLAAIGEDLTRAGQAVAQISLEIVNLRQAYAGRSLTPEDLQALLQKAEELTRLYGASARLIGDDLRAAHQERSQVVTANLVPPLKSAYYRVDEALSRADQAFVRFQDVRLLLSQLLGVSIPG